MILLQRYGSTPMGTFGRLTIDDFSCYTIERPWRNNQRNISCIPEGQYLVVPRRFIRGNYDAYEVVGVPDRSAILFHVGNTMDDVQGCIAPGTNLGDINSKWAVVASRSAFDGFMATMAGREDTIEIFTRGYAGEV